jgi:hypothetical protein
MDAILFSSVLKLAEVEHAMVKASLPGGFGVNP